MKHEERLGEYLRDRKPSSEEEQLALDRVWKDLRLEGGRVPEDVLRDFHADRPIPAIPAIQAIPAPRRPLWVAAAAVVVFAVVLSAILVRDPSQSGPRAAVEFVDGGLQRVSGQSVRAVHAGESLAFGEIIRSSGGASAVLALADGSRIEMRSKSELALEAAEDGVRIRLAAGSVIVTAAKQRTGHLYVQTRDVTVSVVGTVFLVNAEEEGSRVAVIQGEVRVQQGTTAKQLLPGEHVATNPLMASPPVKEEISWSRNAEAHMALLQQSAIAPTPARAGSVTGVVRTTGGSPASGVRVTALRTDITDAADGALRAMASLAETDSTGRYRLENVPPGSYYITAGRVDLPTFYPGTLEISKGAVVSISSAATVSDIDFVIQDTSAALTKASVSWNLRNAALSLKTWSVKGRKAAVFQLDGAWWTDPVVIGRLGVTEDQKRRIEAVAEQYRPVIAQNRADLEKEEAVLARMLEAERIESATVSSQMERVIQSRGEVERANSGMTLEIRQVLTGAQWSQLQIGSQFTGPVWNVAPLNLPNSWLPFVPKTPAFPPSGK